MGLLVQKNRICNVIMAIKKKKWWSNGRLGTSSLRHSSLPWNAFKIIKFLLHLTTWILQDSHGNMGLTPSGNEKLPYEIIKEVTVVKIASGADHIVFLTNHGEVYTCGCAEQGQLGRMTERSCGRYARSGFGTEQIGKDRKRKWELLVLLLHVVCCSCCFVN